MISNCQLQESGTILDASEDEQLQAAIKASLADSAANTCDVDEDDSADSAEEWFDSESESRTSLPKPVEETSPTEAQESLPPQLPPQPPPPPPSQSQAEEETQPEAADDWQKHLGPETDPVSSIVFRYPDGNKEQKKLPCSSTITVNLPPSVFHLWWFHLAEIIEL